MAKIVAEQRQHGHFDRSTDRKSTSFDRCFNFEILKGVEKIEMMRDSVEVCLLEYI